MINRLKETLYTILTNPAHRQFVKFCFVGVLNTALFYGIYFFMLQLGFFYVVAVTAGTIAGIINSFIWNKLFTFRVKGKSAGEMAKFITVYGVQYVSNIVVIHICIVYFFISAELAGLVAIGIGVFISFFGHKYWSFKRRESA